MKMTDAKKQTVTMTFVNGIVRVLGFVMRIWTSRTLGAEMVGIMELAQNVHMLAITPLTSGLPVAISRLTAKVPSRSKERFLQAGLSLVRTFSWIFIPFFFISSPVIARLMGDVRVLPSLWFSAPCILILGYSAVLNGYCYGTNQPIIPAASELIEQTIRVLLTVFLIYSLKGLSFSWKAAIPTAATGIAELAGLYYVLWQVGAKNRKGWPLKADRMTVYKLSVPVTLARLIHTFFRSVTGMLIPLRLQASGLSLTASTILLGQLNGMVSPVLLLPGIFTNALAMMSIPRMAKAEDNPAELKRLIVLNMSVAIPVTSVCAGAVYLFAPFLSTSIFRHPEISFLFRMCAPQMILISVNHILANTLSALGQQRSSINTALAASAVTLFLVWRLACIPHLRIQGVICAQYANLAISMLLNMLSLRKWRKQHQSL